MSLRLQLSTALIIGLLCLSACGKGDDKDKEKPPEPVDKLYNEAMGKLNEHSYKDSVKAF